MQPGSISRKSLTRYNPEVIALAQQHKGMVGLAKKLGLPYPTLQRWAVNDRMPDFTDEQVARQYRKIEKRLVKLNGKRLADVFCKPQPGPELRRMAALKIEPTYEAGPVMDLAIDVELALSRLPKERRDLFLRHLQGYNQQELAAHFGIVRGTVVDWLNAVRHYLARQLER